MPTRSRPGYLREAVSSALAQDSDDFEVLISQDRAPQGLDGETEELCRALAATDPRVRYVAQPRGLGLAGNWNALADEARGEYLALLGDDDRLLPGFVTRLLAALRAERGVLAFGDHWVVDAGGRRDLQATESFTRRYGRASLHAGRVAPGVAAWGGMIPACAMAVRTDAVRRLRFSEDLNTPELELFVRLAAEGGPFVYVGERLAEYRVHAASATSGGLWIDRFAARLVRIEVAPEVEPHKRALLARLVPVGVSRALRTGDRATALALMRSPYYRASDAGLVRALAHRVLATLPGDAAAALVKALRR